MQDLDAIHQDAGAGALVFGLSASQIHRRLKAAAQAAGLGDGFSGHSGRVGMATRMTRLGAPMPVVMRQGRWVFKPYAGALRPQRERQRRALPICAERGSRTAPADNRGGGFLATS